MSALKIATRPSSVLFSMQMFKAKTWMLHNSKTRISWKSSRKMWNLSSMTQRCLTSPSCKTSSSTTLSNWPSSPCSASTFASWPTRPTDKFRANSSARLCSDSQGRACQMMRPQVIWKAWKGKNLPIHKAFSSGLLPRDSQVSKCPVLWVLLNRACLVSPCHLMPYFTNIAKAALRYQKIVTSTSLELKLRWVGSKISADINPDLRVSGNQGPQISRKEAIIQMKTNSGQEEEEVGTGRTMREYTPQEWCKHRVPLTGVKRNNLIKNIPSNQILVAMHQISMSRKVTNTFMGLKRMANSWANQCRVEMDIILSNNN